MAANSHVIAIHFSTCILAYEFCLIDSNHHSVSKYAFQAFSLHLVTAVLVGYMHTINTNTTVGATSVIMAVKGLGSVDKTYDGMFIFGYYIFGFLLTQAPSFVLEFSMPVGTKQLSTIW